MEETPQAMQKMAANIFTDMVMEEAVRDKEIQINKQLKDQEGNYIDPDKVDEYFEKQDKQNEVDEDDALDEEEEKIMRSLREKRYTEIKNEYSEQQENMIKGHGSYTEIVEQDFLPNVTGSKYVVCHFYHKDFERCKIVDMHLRKIARVHTEARFIYLDAEKTPFFVEKLQIQMLPSIICFVDGVAVDRIVGFSELGNKDDFPTLALTRRLINGGILIAKNTSEKGQTIIKRGKDDSDSGDDDC